MHRFLTAFAQSVGSFSEEVGTLILEKPLTFIVVTNLGLAIGAAIVFARGY